MDLVDQRTGSHVIDRDACLRLLAADDVGRLGVVSGGTPLILPVNYALDGEDIVLRTAPGSKLDAAPRARACFEIDRFDHDARSGWSVLALGRLEEVTPYDRSWPHVQSIAVDPWASSPKTHWLRLVPDHISGRQVP